MIDFESMWKEFDKISHEMCCGWSGMDYNELPDDVREAFENFMCEIVGDYSYE